MSAWFWVSWLSFHGPVLIHGESRPSCSSQSSLMRPKREGFEKISDTYTASLKTNIGFCHVHTLSDLTHVSHGNNSKFDELSQQ